MGTTLQPEISRKNKYWIDRHRYYELKHFCLQYPTWKKMRTALVDVPQSKIDEPIGKSGAWERDITGDVAIRREYYGSRIEMVEKAVAETDDKIGKYILLGILNGKSFDVIRAKYDIPCGKEKYYELYRRFFWILDKLRK